MIASRNWKAAMVTEPQRETINSKEKITGFVSGRGGGKTVVGGLKALMRARDGEPFCCVSPSYKIMHETTWPVFHETAKRTGQFVSSTWSPVPTVRFTTCDGGVASIVFRSGDDPDSLRGMTLMGAWIDEASIQKKQVFDLILPCLRYRGRPDVFLDMTFTPRGKSHWTYPVFYQRKSVTEAKPVPGTYLVQAHTRSNPFNPPGFLEMIQSQYTTLLAKQELAGEFIDLVGFMFQHWWFELVDEAPAAARRVRYWDKAATQGAGSYTVGLLMARSDQGVFYIEDVVRGQWSPHERDVMMQQTAAKDQRNHGHQVHIYVEQEPGSGGKEAVQQTIRMLCRYPVYADLVSGVKVRTVDGILVPGQGKIDRAQPAAAQAQAGNIKLCNRHWTPEYLEEMCAFPESSVSDQVDATSGAFNKLAQFARLEVERTIEATRHADPDPSRHGIQWEKSSKSTVGAGRNRRRGRRTTRGR